MPWRGFQGNKGIQECILNCDNRSLNQSGCSWSRLFSKNACPDKMMRSYTCSSHWKLLSDNNPLKSSAGDVSIRPVGQHDQIPPSVGGMFFTHPTLSGGISWRSRQGLCDSYRTLRPHHYKDACFVYQITRLQHRLLELQQHAPYMFTLLIVIVTFWYRYPKLYLISHFL